MDGRKGRGKVMERRKEEEREAVKGRKGRENKGNEGGNNEE